MIHKKYKEITYGDLIREFSEQYPNQAIDFRPHDGLPFALIVWLKSGDIIIVQYHMLLGTFFKIGEKLSLVDVSKEED